MSLKNRNVDNISHEVVAWAIPYPLSWYKKALMFSCRRSNLATAISTRKTIFSSNFHSENWLHRLLKSLSTFNLDFWPSSRINNNKNNSSKFTHKHLQSFSQMNKVQTKAFIKMELKHDECRISVPVDGWTTSMKVATYL